MRQNFVVQFIWLLKSWSCDMQWGVVMEKYWTHSIDQCRLQALQVLVHLINQLSILLRCNGFAEIQKAVVDQMGSRPPNNDHDLFWCKFGFGASSQFNHWAVLYQFYKIHFSSHVTIWSRNGSLLLCRTREDECKIDSHWEFAMWLRELKPGLCNNLEGWDGEGGSRGRRHRYTYGWFMLICGRNQHNIIEQLPYN